MRLGPYAHLIEGPAGTEEAAGPSVLVIVLDTTGAARLSVYGADRATTPHLEGFLERRSNHAVFANAYSNSSWTVPSHASLLTGLIPSEHGAHRRRGDAEFRGAMAMHADATLTERLRDSGYHTVGVLANWIVATAGVQRGFVRLIRPRYPHGLELSGERLRRWLVPGLYTDGQKRYPDAPRIASVALAELEGCESRACFGLLNFVDAHEPYVPPAACRGRFGPPWSLFESVGKGDDGGIAAFDPPGRIAHLAARHDEELCGLDRALTQFLETLEERGFLERGWVFIVGDHGEAFLEHDSVMHGTSLYNEQVRVPLIVLPPDGVEIRRTRQPVSLIDLTATIAEIAKVMPVGGGKSLLADHEHREAKLEIFAVRRSEVDQDGEGSFAAAAVVTDRYKLIRSDGEPMLFDLLLDPGETSDITEGAGAVFRELEPRLPRLGPATEEAQTISREELEMLKELGYVD
jgi:arylsulfatase A-like enzyme